MPSPQLDFLLFGAPKSGTTSLAHQLATHPQLALTTPKESRYFDLHYQEGQSYLEAFLSHATEGQLLGDASPQNLLCSYTAERIHTHNPKAKLIAILREPVARAFSNWWMHYSSGKERRSFRECLDFEMSDVEILRSKPEPEMWVAYNRARDTREVPRLFYLYAGLYAQHIDVFLKYFQRKQMLFLSFQQYQAAPQQTLSRIGSFLQIDPQLFCLETDIRNQAKGPVGSLLHKWARRLKLDLLVPEPWQIKLRNGLRKWGDKPPSLDVESKAKAASFFASHNEELRNLLGEDLW